MIGSAVTTPSALSFSGTLAFLSKGDTWYVYQDYFGNVTHNHSYALDLTAGSPRNLTTATHKLS